MWVTVGEENKVSACYLLFSSFHLHMFELPEAAHGLHLLQVSVEGQSAQTKAVAAVADLLQSLHLFNNGGHRYWWWDSRREFYILLARSGLITHCLLT